MRAAGRNCGKDLLEGAIGWKRPKATAPGFSRRRRSDFLALNASTRAGAECPGLRAPASEIVDLNPRRRGEMEEGIGEIHIDAKTRQLEPSDTSILLADLKAPDE